MPIYAPGTSWSNMAGSPRCWTGSSPRSAIRWRIWAGCSPDYWRFGAYELEAGGIGTRAALLGGYEAASGQKVDHGAVAYWEVMATVRWAVIALMQAARHFRRP